MSAVFEDIVAAVGYTPLVRINRLGSGNATVLAKLESKNPCGSVKDRIAKYMVRAAEEQGLIKADTVIVEPTSGNTENRVSLNTGKSLIVLLGLIWLSKRRLGGNRGVILYSSTYSPYSNSNLGSNNSSHIDTLIE